MFRRSKDMMLESSLFLCIVKCIFQLFKYMMIFVSLLSKLKENDTRTTVVQMSVAAHWLLIH